MAVAADEQVPLICGIAEPDLGCLTTVDCTALLRSARERASALIAAVRYRQVSVLKGDYASCRTTVASKCLELLLVGRCQRLNALRLS